LENRDPGRSKALRLLAFVLAASSAIACRPRDADRSAVLWPDGAPRAKGKRFDDRPMLYYYVPPAEQRTETAVVVAGGGSYGHHQGIEHEGAGTARWLVEHGITAIVVRYRVGWAGRYNHVDYLADGQRAVRTVRAQAEELGIDPDRIGMIGYSAGGHLAGMVSTQCSGDQGDREASDPIERASCRVAWAVLVYPVITMDDRWVHRRSRNNLLDGIDSPSKALLEQLSLDTQVTSANPPTMLVHSKRDTKVDWHNSQLYYDALVEHGVPAEFQLFEDGRHGVGIADDPKRMPQMSTWPARMLAWVESLR
jgi:acetyl esterase/lipase